VAIVTPTKLRRVEDLNSLLEISAAMNAEKDLASLLKLIVDETTKVLNAERTTLYLYDVDREELWSLIAQGEDVGEIRLKLGQGLAGFVAESKESIKIDDAYSDSRFNKEVDKKTGFTYFDHKTSGLQNSDLVILAARPSMGKTAFALNVARNAALDANVPVAVFSLEMSKEQLSMRMLSSEARLNSTRLRSGFISQEDWMRITEAAGNLTNAPIYIDDSPGITAMEIRAKSRRLKMDKNVGLVIIDYLQLMQGRHSAERRELEISEISRSLKALAKELDIPVLAISQLNRMLEQRSDKRPQLSDLRESGALEQDADVVAFIYRDEIYNKDEDNPNKGKAELIISKQRNGPVGVISLTFLDAYTRFENLAPEDMVEGPRDF